jgi:1-aminocyclopropane-1-carboxylate deaminase/D-cysteine desulfhydrase-like pyridoxal-dependent ACC family enzyme
MLAPLVSAWPRIAERLLSAPLGEFPTPVTRAARLERELGAGPLYIKRDDLSSSVYGGNKVRTLEVLFGAARAAGAREIVAVGPYGSNQAVATALHAPRFGLHAHAILFAQPASRAALDNLRVLLSHVEGHVALPHWSFVPAAIWSARGPGRFVMPPGGATPHGALGYVAAGLELAEQIARAELPVPRAIYLPVGSTCTCAGLLVGLMHGARLGLLPGALPRVVAVRVTPWPVTSRLRILSLAVQSSRRLAELAENRSLELSRAELGPHLELDGRELGSGYGFATPSGLDAISLFERNEGLVLDSIYSAKAAAAFVRGARDGREGPLLFWSTKSSAALPLAAPEHLTRATPRLAAWIRECERRLAS